MPDAVAFAPIAIEAAPDAVVVLPERPPIEMACPPVAVPPPAAYCACATFMLAPATSITAAIALATDDLLDLPRADEISDAATQAPRDSFQIERYVRFMTRGSFANVRATSDRIEILQGLSFAHLLDWMREFYCE